MSEKLTILELLERGRARVAKKWCQGAFRRNGGFCALGALNGRGMFRSGTVSDLAASVLERYIEGDVSLWNDDAFRTQADVIALYDRAIEAERSRPSERGTR